MQNERRTRVHLLARTACADRDHHARVESQLRALRAYAAERGWVVAGATVEVGVGGNSLDRQGLGEILTLAASPTPPFSILLAVSADRIARDIHVLVMVQRRLQENGISIHTLEGSWTSPPFEMTLDALAERRRRKPPERITAVGHEDQGDEKTGAGRVPTLSKTYPLRATARSANR